MKEEIAALVRYRLEQADAALEDTQFLLKDAFPRELSQDFHKAFELRQTADYRALHSPSAEQAREMLAKAVRFVQCLKDYLSK